MSRILIIDDEDEIRAVLRQMLERAGHEVRDAPDGKAGFELQRQEPSDLVITDLIMPEQEGIETIIKFKETFPEIKIIAISGGGWLDPGDYLHWAQKMGACRAFSKPIKREDLLGAVQELLQ